MLSCKTKVHKVIVQSHTVGGNLTLYHKLCCSLGYICHDFIIVIIIYYYFTGMYGNLVIFRPYYVVGGDPV